MPKLLYARPPVDAEGLAGLADRPAVTLATAQPGAHAQPWIWGRPSPQPRTLRRKFVYLL
ncbi:hypothetical protein AB0M44_46620 [Streptosporangium subroseum]|uniref:hypothetical protein n=1 Tax=Streptosporangium subroseum TaxID=106412 RepID=UPI00341651C9